MKSPIRCIFPFAVSLAVAGCSSGETSPPAATGGDQATSGGNTQGGSGQGGSTSSNGGATPGKGGTTSSNGGGSSGGAGNGGNPPQGTGGSSAGGSSAGGSSAGNGQGGATAGSTSGANPVAAHGPLKVVGTSLVDSHDAPVQLKGPSSMWLNWESQKFAEDKQGLMFLRDNWNASLIRAAMGVDTTDTDDYLSNSAVATAAVDQIVQNAIDLGLYVIIDWHDGAADKHQAEAISFFTQMATKWGSYPNVIYETFNEPTTQAWSTVLKPYHQAVIAAIRAVDPDNLIILGTRNYSQYVDEPAADPVAGTNLMYTLHFYSCTHKQPLRDRAEAAFGKGLPLFVTEWGATNADGGTPKNPDLCLDEAQLWHTWMNSHKISWAAWKFDRCVDKTCYFNSTMTIPTSGGWTDDMLTGHAPFVRDRMRE